MLSKNKNPYKTSYLQTLQKARIKQGLSYVEIARKAGISQQNIYAVFNGKNKYLPTVKKVAETVGVFFERIVS